MSVNENHKTEPAINEDSMSSNKGWWQEAWRLYQKSGRELKLSAETSPTVIADIVRWCCCTNLRPVTVITPNGVWFVWVRGKEGQPRLILQGKGLPPTTLFSMEKIEDWIEMIERVSYDPKSSIRGK